MATTTALSLSFDMKKFHVIDSSNGIQTLNLTTSNGIKIESVNGKLTISRATSTPAGTQRTLQVEETVDGKIELNNLWKITYHEGKDIAYIIGVTDVMGKTVPKKYTYDLDGGNTILYMRRDTDKLILTKVDII